MLARTPPLRILHVIGSLGMGGAEVWLMELLRYFHRQGQGAPQLDFLITSGKPGVFDDEARELGARIHYLRYSRLHLPAFRRGFRRVLERGHYDAIHDHQGYDSGWHYLMGLGLLPPVRVTHVHNRAICLTERGPFQRSVAQVGKRLVARHATHLAGTSRLVLEEHGFYAPAFGHLPKTPLYCGFDAHRFGADRADARAALRREFGWPAHARVVLFAGRMDPSADPGHRLNSKNSAFAVEVGIESARRNPDLRLLLVGETTAAVEILEDRVEDAGLCGRIKFAGVRHDIGRLMRGADALFFPSQSEGLGMVAVEAQTAGLPVLASVGVPRECVIDPSLVEYRNLADGVAAWAGDLVRLTSRRKVMRGSEMRLARTVFSIENSATAVTGLYANLDLGGLLAPIFRGY